MCIWIPANNQSSTKSPNDTDSGLERRVCARKTGEFVPIQRVEIDWKPLPIDNVYACMYVCIHVSAYDTKWQRGFQFGLYNYSTFAAIPVKKNKPTYLLGQKGNEKCG